LVKSRLVKQLPRGWVQTHEERFEFRFHGR
jgi:hypothetical protein